MLVVLDKLVSTYSLILFKIHLSIHFSINTTFGDIIECAYNREELFDRPANRGGGQYRGKRAENVRLTNENACIFIARFG